MADLWYEHYEKAEKALEGQDWTEAIEQINQAVERKGDSGARVRTYGMKIISYFPYLKMGVAYYQLGQLNAALQAFETEERLGAVTGSRDAFAELQQFRRLALDAKEAAVAAEADRIQQIVRESLDQAGGLETEGNLDEAMSAVGRALAVDPDNRQALTAMESLRNQVAEQQAAQELETRVARLVEQGRGHLEAGRYNEASSVLRQADSLAPSDEIQTLLDDAQSSLRAELERAQDTERLITAGLDRTRELETAGQLAAALDELQSVIALDPSNSAAQEIQVRLLEAQKLAQQEGTRRETLENLLAEAERHFGAGRYEESLSAANRVLALDSGNAPALQYVGRAYNEINQILLGTGASENIPPAIRFADFRQELDDGLLAQRIESPDFRLSGVVIDNSPVEIAFYDPSNAPIPATSNSQPLGNYTITEFNVSYRLRPGLSIVRLVATDTESLSSSSEYAVLYERRFFRSPWFYTLASIGILAAGAVAYSQRVRRRNRLLKRRFNPYVAGAPVLGDDLFLGRDPLLDRILQTIHNNSLLLYGERRIGKTSIQHHLKKRLETVQDPEYDFYPVYIDLQGTPEDKFFSTLAEDIFQDLSSILDGMEPAAPASGAEYGYREFVRDIHKVLKKLKGINSKKIKLVLLMDEVDVLNEYDPKVNQKLRSLFMKSFAENLVTVVSGVEIKKRWEGEGSPWYNFFEEIEVKRFRKEDARELIERPIRGVFKLEDGLADHIISVTDGKPYLIQKLCVALVNRLHEENRRTITLGDVEAIGRPEEV